MKPNWKRIIEWIAAVWGVAAAGLAAEPGRILIAPHSEWKYHASATRPPADWNTPSFDDRSWQSGQAGFGFGDGDDRTVLTNMPGRFTSVYLRATFVSPSAIAGESLYLYANYDDGFVAYLNGTQVAAASVSRSRDRLRIAQHEADGFAGMTRNGPRFDKQ